MAYRWTKPKEEWINSHKETKENEYIAYTVV